MACRTHCSNFRVLGLGCSVQRLGFRGLGFRVQSIKPSPMWGFPKIRCTFSGVLVSPIIIPILVPYIIPFKEFRLWLIWHGSFSYGASQNSC